MAVERLPTFFGNFFDSGIQKWGRRLHLEAQTSFEFGNLSVKHLELIHLSLHETAVSIALAENQMLADQVPVRDVPISDFLG